MARGAHASGKISAAGPLVCLLWLCVASCGSVAPGSDIDVPVTCDNFCNIMWRHCSGAWRMYATVSECNSVCATWPDVPAGLNGSGNSRQCRFLYAALAIHAQDETGYCLNADAAGGQMCHD